MADHVSEGGKVKQNDFDFPAMTEESVTKLVRAKHALDICVPQCKTGPSVFGSGPLILDVWVMPRSWVKPVVGYEIKVSRFDFLRDKKWREYTEYCAEFYFVTPWGMIEVDDVPDPAGLYYVNKKGTGLYLKKRATYRLNKDIPNEIFMYVLMWRVQDAAWNLCRFKDGAQ